MVGPRLAALGLQATTVKEYGLYPALLQLTVERNLTASHLTLRLVVEMASLVFVRQKGGSSRLASNASKKFQSFFITTSDTRAPIREPLDHIIERAIWIVLCGHPIARVATFILRKGRKASKTPNTSYPYLSHYSTAWSQG